MHTKKVAGLILLGILVGTRIAIARDMTDTTNRPAITADDDLSHLKIEAVRRELNDSINQAIRHEDGPRRELMDWDDMDRWARWYRADAVRLTAILAKLEGGAS